MNDAQRVVQMKRLQRRQDFLSAARGQSWATRGSVVQARNRGDSEPPRIGFTATRRLGGAVVRNHIRRRLKEAVRTGLADELKPGYDYVFIGRSQTASRPFDQLKTDLRDAVRKIHSGRTSTYSRRKERRRPS